MLLSTPQSIRRTSVTEEKVRENRLRRVAARRGLRLVNSRRRDEKALDFGRYWLLSRAGSVIAGGGDLFGVNPARLSLRRPLTLGGVRERPVL
jgi:hypothetical protein